MAAEANSRISPAKLALAVRRLRAERENLDLIASDPIAIIGMACRFPGGADSPEEFWTALAEGRDCVGEIPAGRWKDASTLPVRLRQGAYLAEIDGFDAAYFGISPREAQHIDPQQRLLLEVTWEALWDAGLDPGARRATWDLIAQVRNSGVTVVLVSHFMDEVEELCDRVAILERGRIAALDTPAGLVDSAGGEYRMRFRPTAPLDEQSLAIVPGVTGVERHGAHVAVTGTRDFASAVTTELARRQVVVADLRIEGRSLDSAYVALTGRTMDT